MIVDSFLAIHTAVFKMAMTRGVCVRRIQTGQLMKVPSYLISFAGQGF